jgi:uncharacterized membrane protein
MRSDRGRDRSVLSEEEVQGLRDAVRTVKRDVARVYSSMSRREKVLGAKIIANQLLDAAMVRLEEEGTLDHEALATQVRAELQRVLIDIFQDEFDVELGELVDEWEA